jgi:hypothetical protein
MVGAGAADVGERPAGVWLLPLARRTRVFVGEGVDVLTLRAGRIVAITAFLVADLERPAGCRRRPADRDEFAAVTGLWPKVKLRRNVPSVEDAITRWPSTAAVSIGRSCTSPAMSGTMGGWCGIRGGGSRWCDL